MIKPYNKTNGFTLIEVMVALFVLTIALSALLLQTNRIVSNTSYLRDKAFAQWVASNELTLERMANRYNQRMLNDSKSGSTMMGGREWFWTITPQATTAVGFTQLVITVSIDPEAKQPLLTFVGLIDRFHRTTGS